MGIDKLFINTTARLLAGRTEFYMALAAMVMGTMLFIGGFLAELIIRNNPNRNTYQIEKTTNAQ
jgi:hypothetical protein